MIIYIDIIIYIYNNNNKNTYIKDSNHSMVVFSINLEPYQNSVSSILEFSGGAFRQGVEPNDCIQKVCKVYSELLVGIYNALHCIKDPIFSRVG